MESLITQFLSQYKDHISGYGDTHYKGIYTYNGYPHTGGMPSLYWERPWLIQANNGSNREASKLHVTCLCVGNPLVTSQFHLPKASDVECISMSLHHHALSSYLVCQINGLVQERRNSSALALELHLSCINPSKCYIWYHPWCVFLYCRSSWCSVDCGSVPLICDILVWIYLSLDS